MSKLITKLAAVASMGIASLASPVFADAGPTTPSLTGYLLNAAKVASVQGAAFGLSPYFRMSYALGQDDLKTAIARISEALGALE